MKASSRTLGAAAASKQRERRRNLVVFGAIGLVVVGLIVAVVLIKPPQLDGPTLPAGESSDQYSEEVFPIQEAIHIERNELHEPYNSNPPTSGAHYADAPDMKQVGEGFYDDASRQVDEDILHAMEHGYVVIWYDCTKIAKDQCDPLKASLKQLISSINGGYHLIGNPRTGQMDTVIALTSWGRLERLDAFDPVKIRQFIDRNLNQAPEPGGP